VDEQLPPPAFAAGLCDRCVHAIVRPTRRDTTYLRCGLAGTDHRFPKYPQLPVRSCAGYDAAPA
jgi:hypothetical protein